MARSVTFVAEGLLRTGLVLVFIAAWQLFVSAEWVNRTIVPPPTQVAWKTITLFFSSQLLASLFITLQEIGTALSISIAIGVPLGALMAASRRFASVVSPFIALLLSAPLVSFIPLIIMVAGISMTAVIVIAILASIALIAVNTRTGVENIDRLLLTVAGTFGHGPIATFWKVTLPGAMPYIVVGVRLGTGRAILGVVVGEFFAGTDGLAYRAAEFQNFLQTDSLYASVAWLAALGVGINLALTALEKKLSAWRTA